MGPGRGLGRGGEQRWSSQLTSLIELDSDERVTKGVRNGTGVRGRGGGWFGSVTLGGRALGDGSGTAEAARGKVTWPLPWGGVDGTTCGKETAGSGIGHWENQPPPSTLDSY